VGGNGKNPRSGRCGAAHPSPSALSNSRRDCSSWKNDQKENTDLQSFEGDERNFIYTDMMKVLPWNFVVGCTGIEPVT
jgi:hypothetical protein